MHEGVEYEMLIHKIIALVLQSNLNQKWQTRILTPICEMFDLQYQCSHGLLRLSIINTWRWLCSLVTGTLS